MESSSAHTLLQEKNVRTSKTLEKEGKLPSNQCFSGLGDGKRESGAVWGAGRRVDQFLLFVFELKNSWRNRDGLFRALEDKSMREGCHI